MLDLLVHNATLPDGRQGMGLGITAGKIVAVDAGLTPATTPALETLDADSLSCSIRNHITHSLGKPCAEAGNRAESDRGRYTFVVAPNANKVQIKQAIEEIFNVKVTNVNTLNRAGKRKRTRTGFGQRVNQKRAIVTVAEGQTIDIFGN